MSESELRQEIALLLYEREKLTLTQASRADPRQEQDRQRRRLPADLAALVEGDEHDRALPLAAQLLDTFAVGPSSSACGP